MNVLLILDGVQIKYVVVSAFIVSHTFCESLYQHLVSNGFDETLMRLVMIRCNAISS